MSDASSPLARSSRVKTWIRRRHIRQHPHSNNMRTYQMLSGKRIRRANNNIDHAQLSMRSWSDTHVNVTRSIPTWRYVYVQLRVFAHMLLWYYRIFVVVSRGRPRRHFLSKVITVFFKFFTRLRAVKTFYIFCSLTFVLYFFVVKIEYIFE